MRDAPNDAEIYAALHDGTPGDLAFYRRLCAGASRGLELGCGTGRMLAALDEPGRRWVGLELDAHKLDLARRTLAAGVAAGRIELRVGDMRCLSLGERFERVLLPHSGLYCLPSIAAVDACLRGVRDHLVPDGRFVLDAWAADDFHAGSQPGDLDDDESTALPDLIVRGVPHRVRERSTWDRDAHTIVVRYALEPIGGGAVRHHEVVHRYFTAPELIPRLEAAGLQVESLHGGFDGEPYDADAGSMVIVARPAELSS
jgi:SAM-dependent methyltransferase